MKKKKIKPAACEQNSKIQSQNGISLFIDMIYLLTKHFSGLKFKLKKNKKNFMKFQLITILLLIVGLKSMIVFTRLISPEQIESNV